jgi:hypothetical protein
MKQSWVQKSKKALKNNKLVKTQNAYVYICNILFRKVYKIGCLKK